MNTKKSCSSSLSVVLANRCGRIIVACTFAAIGPSAIAASTWNFGSSCGSSSSSSFGNTYTCSGTNGGPNVNASAWGSSATATGFQTAYLSYWSGSGFGVASRAEATAAGGIGNVTSPNHAIDNNPTSSVPDMIVLKFDTAVALSTVNLGWVSNDADFTLMAYKGASPPTIGGKIVSNLNTGWALVENSSGSSTGTRSVNAGDVTSSWWLISAYSSSYGGGTLDGYKDYFKLLAVASRDVTQSGSVPEPGSLALLGAGLMGLMASRRRSQKNIVD